MIKKIQSHKSNIPPNDAELTTVPAALPAAHPLAPIKGLRCPKLEPKYQ
jgi:hypothetical protein